MHRWSAPPAALASRAAFCRQLQLAFSAELGAALAYRGHAAAVPRATERQHLIDIRAQELEHRARVGRILGQCGWRPDPRLELRNRCVGTAIAVFCHVGGWFWPMYGAGWLERRNIAEYEVAARLAVQCGAVAHVDDLLQMAEIEWDHEHYFRGQAARHWLARVVRVWPAPPPRAEIRRGFDRFLAGQPARYVA